MMFANKSFGQRNYKILKLDFTNLFAILITCINYLLLNIHQNLHKIVHIFYDTLLTDLISIKHFYQFERAHDRLKFCVQK